MFSFRSIAIRIFALLFIVGAGFFVWSHPVMAQDTFGIDRVEQTDLNLSGTDPITIVIRIINTILALLGIIAVGIVLYAGFLYLTSAGNEDKIAQAKKLLTNGLIGLVIILSSFAIVKFVLNKFLDVTGSSNTTLTDDDKAYCEKNP